MCILPHAVDADPGFAQNRGDLGQGTGFIHQLHTQIIGGGQFGQRRCGIYKVARRLAKDRTTQTARNVTDICHHSAGGRAFARTGTAQHDLSHSVTFQHHHIRAAIQLRQWRGIGHKAGLHALLQPTTGLLRHTQQLDLISHVGGGTDVFDADALDAFQLDAVKINPGAKSDGRENRQLMRRINAAHIQLRISFKVAQPVGLGKNLLIGFAGILHPRQDIIA